MQTIKTIIVILFIFCLINIFYAVPELQAGWQDVPDAGPGKCVSGCGGGGGGGGGSSRREERIEEHNREVDEYNRRVDEMTKLSNEANSLYSAGRYREALELDLKARQVCPYEDKTIEQNIRNERAMIDIMDAKAAANTGDYDRAVSLIREAISVNPEYADTWKGSLQAYEEKSEQKKEFRKRLQSAAAGLMDAGEDNPGPGSAASVKPSGGSAIEQARANLMTTKQGLAGSDEDAKKGAMQVFDTPLTGANGEPLPKYVVKDRRVQKAGVELSRMEKELARIEKEKTELVRQRNTAKDREAMAELTKKVDEAEKAKQKTLYKISRTKIHIEELDRRIEASHAGAAGAGSSGKGEKQ